MTRFERWSVAWTSLLTFLTGVGYLWTKYFLANDDPWSLVNHPLQPWFLKAHVLVAPLLVFAVGVIALKHIWRHVRSRTPKGWRSGVALVAVIGPLTLTGYLIQVVAHLGWLRALAYAHIGLGFVYAAALAAHQWALRWERRNGRGRNGVREREEALESWGSGESDRAARTFTPGP